MTNTYEVKLRTGWPGQHGYVTYAVNVDDTYEPEAEAASKARARREYLCVVAVAQVRKL